ncbi:hypothetical protein J1N35_043835, partial [Gossypium stocksii]
GNSKVSVKMPTSFKNVTTTPKFNRRKVSTVQNFLPGCRRGTTSDFGLHRQIAVDQGKFSSPSDVTNEIQYLDIGSSDYDYLVLYVVRLISNKRVTT